MIITVARKPKQPLVFLNYEEYKDFNAEQTTRFVDRVFQYYREKGFPYYPTDRVWRAEKYLQLQKTPYKNLLEEDKSIRQTMIGLSLAWSYMPHAYSVQCGKMRSPIQAFEEDKILLGVIRKKISFKANITHSSIRKLLRAYTGHQGVSNFRPTAAACIYHHFGKDKTVWDMSCGYGGRLLGADLAGVGKYIGTEPCGETFNGLKQLVSDFIKIPTELHQCGSEEFIPAKESLDLCFTSPPYFNTERYSHEPSQSWLKFPTKAQWINGFLKKTFQNCWFGLKPDGKMIINIANVKSFLDLEEETLRVAKEVGFALVGTWKLSLSAMMSDGFKYEPIFIFRKTMMKEGTRVKDTTGKVGTSLGLVERYGVWWLLVEWDVGGKAIVLEQCLKRVDKK